MPGHHIGAKGAAPPMALSTADIRVIYICCRILENSLPYEDEIFRVLEKCRKALGHSDAALWTPRWKKNFTGGSLEDLYKRIR